MKIKLLLSALFISGAAFAQQPVNWFYNLSPDISSDSYSLVQPSAPLNENNAGENLTWNFNDILMQTGASSANTSAPTDSQLVDYPGTTAVGNNYYYVGDTNSENHIFFSNADNTISLTGVTLPDVTLRYIDMAVIGAFPLQYGYSNTAPTSGTFTGYGSEGTFTGTIETSVDAYGLFSQNVELLTQNVPVTRLKIVQEVALFVSGFPVGNATQTIYTYHDATGIAPIFKSTTTHITAPFLSIDETTAIYEVYGATLGTDKYKFNKTVIAPNPVADVLHFAGDKAITGVTITDASGRVVLKSKAGNEVAVSHLSTGVYYVTVQSGNGTEVQKMIKR